GVAADLEAMGIVASLARPDGNLTGLELRILELLGKQLELFKAAVPTISRVAVLVDPTRPDHARIPSNIEQQGQQLGVELRRAEAGAPEAFEAAFAAMVRGGVNALMIMEAALFAEHRQQLIALALQHRLPTISGGRYWAESGSLLAYGADVAEMCRRLAILVDKVLKGAQPATLPVEGPYKFHLVVNLKTAEALGLTLSPQFLFQANEVLK